MPDNITTGAMPAAAGAMPAQTPPADQPTPPATGDSEALGEGGKQALQQEREARKAAERELKKLTDKVAALELAGKSEQEQAVAKAKVEGAAEAKAQLVSFQRQATVREALVLAGCTAPGLLDKADEFARLQVADDGSVTGLDKAVSAAKAAYPALFTARRPGGSADGGQQGAAAGLPSFTRQQLRDPAFFAKNKDAILAAQREGRITG